MKKEKSRVVYQADKIRDFRELINRTVEKYPDQIAYKYKIKHGKMILNMLIKLIQNLKTM